MPMEGLLALVERLIDRIDAHGATLRGSEALTRYALIDPMLRELGWDTSDPDMVIPDTARTVERRITLFSATADP